MTDHQQAVLQAVKLYGPIHDAALVPLVQHLADIRISSSGVRSRRAELVDAGKVQQVGEHRMPSGRFAALWEVA